jgi:hypothetical protein
VRSFIAKEQRQSQLEATSGSSSVVVLEHCTKPFSALDLTSDGTDSFLWIDELVAQALMVSLAMIMLNEVGNSSLK